MPRDRVRQLVRMCGAMAVPMMLVGVSACGNDDQQERVALLASPPARQLVGTWTARFWLDMGFGRSTHDDSTTIAGTISLEEDTYGHVSADALENATHAGVYNLDFSKFGFSAREPGELPAAIARVSDSPRGNSGDSLIIVLSPGTALFPVVMTGLIAGDSAAGQWIASANRSGGISGHFLMKRLR
jgi:hypothetical protein